MYVSVCPTWDVWNGRSYHHAVYTILKSFAWQGAQTAFWAYTMHGSREKAFETLLPDPHPSRARTVTLPVTLGRMNLPLCKKAIGTFLKGMHWTTCPSHHRYHSCYCFLCEWGIDKAISNKSPVYHPHPSEIYELCLIFILGFGVGMPGLGRS